MTATTTTSRPGALTRHPVRLLLVAGLVLMAGWLVWKGWRVYRLAQSLRAHQQHAAALLDDGRTSLDPAILEGLVLGVRADVLALEAETAVFMPLTPYLGWLPTVGPLAAEAPHLLTMADAGTATAVHALRALRPVLETWQAGDGALALLPDVVDAAAAGEADLVQARLQFERLVTARAAMDPGRELPGRAGEALALLDALIPVAQDGLALLPVLPAILGDGQSVTYLILAQNEEELRPTGGFISGVGVLRFEDGRLAALDFEDASLVVDLRLPYDFPPAPYQDFMGLDYFLFRDANFWPDFPTSAEKAMALYTFTRGVPVDGVIAIDQRFVEALVCAIGPLKVEGGGQVSCDNILNTMRESFRLSDDSGNYADRKAFIGVIAASIMARLQGDVGALNPLELAQTLHALAEERHLQMYSRRPAAATVLDDLGWSNRVTARAGQDFLLAVDMNVGYNKVNGLVTRLINYEVALDATGAGEARAGLRYQHLIDKNAPCDHSVPVYDENLTYAQLIDDCYWNYLRLYTPAGSRLLDAGRHPEPGDVFLTGRPWPGDAGVVDGDPSPLTVFDNFLLLHYGQTLETHFRYDLPTVTRREPDGSFVYRLTVRKQAGTGAEPLTVTVTLPDGADLITATPSLTPTAEGALFYSTLLNKDIEIVVRYELP